MENLCFPHESPGHVWFQADQILGILERVEVLTRPEKADATLVNEISCVGQEFEGVAPLETRL